MEELRNWAPIIIAVGSLFSTWLIAGRTAKRSEIAADREAQAKQHAELKGEMRVLKDDVDGLEERTAKAEMAIAHLPDKDTSHRLEMAISRLEGRMEVMDERLKPVAAMAARAQERMFQEAVS
ncbi:DUF2730 family protein [Ancylobacter sp. TS-1]|uniref:DUF2730 family protein n=1 Tax=Ancylobacter sp. TS-1 TaxID=1850374 RepID=UPI001265B298|nr:DUF2730 family protein [Ancylobacter sp. TS-1]QFR32397.1 DUF2730 family protein [Ancylobacter sp. TS-1]